MPSLPPLQLGSPSPIPEPSSLAIGILGLASLFATLRSHARRPHPHG
jgi:hypothetical protein